MFLIFSSCAVHNGNISSNAVISDSNFRIIGTAIGESSTMRFLGIGGLGEDALVYQAKTDLYKKYLLKRGQALTNITVDFKREFYVFLFKTKVTLTAEIVDFNQPKEDRPEVFDNNYQIQYFKGFKVTDTILYKNAREYSKGIIIGLDTKHVYIQSIDSLEIEPLTEKDFSDVFSLEGTFKYSRENYSVGDEITLQTVGGGNSMETINLDYLKGVVVGISENNALVYISDYKKFMEIKIEKL